MPRSVVFRLITVLMLVPVTQGCATVAGTPEPGSASEFLSGTFGGVLTVDGTEIEGLLELTQSEGRFDAVFNSEGFGFEAAGSGSIRGDRLELVLSYEMDCRGELRMRGVFRPSEGRWEGELVASDCTGDAAGTFRFISGGR